MYSLKRMRVLKNIIRQLVSVFLIAAVTASGAAPSVAFAADLTQSEEEGAFDETEQESCIPLEEEALSAGNDPAVLSEPSFRSMEGILPQRSRKKAYFLRSRGSGTDPVRIGRRIRKKQ